MKMTTLGKGGAQISQFGLGAMSFAGIYGDASEEDSHAVLDACLELDVSHIDTSNVYGTGRSEEIIGSWLAARPGARDKMNIATKGGIKTQPVRWIDKSAEHLEAELDKSLARLGVDCVDLYYVHRLEADRPVEETAGALATLIAKGKTKALGFSEIAPSTLRRAATECHIAAVQSEYSLATRAPELGLIQACAELGTALVAFSPVGRSMLTDRPFTRERIDGNGFLSGNPRFIEPNLTANFAATDAFRALAAEMGAPAAAVAIAWCIAQGDHVVPIPGTSSVPHLKELVQGGDLALTAEDLARIDAVLPVGWAHGDRYNVSQWVGPERYC